MRISGFLVGGLVGIAAAAYLSRRSPGSLAWAARTTDGLVSSLKLMMIEKALDRKFGAEPKQADKQAAPRTSTDSDKSSWKTIESMVNADPQLKQTADQIIAEASASTASASAQPRH